MCYILFMDQFERLLERIRHKEHPEFGTLTWDRQTREFHITVTFERNGEPDPMVRARALRYLESLSEEERDLVDIDIGFRQGTPVKATVHVDTGALTASRLRKLSQAG